MDTSAWGVRVSVSVAELLAGLGSLVPAGGVTVAVLVDGPVAVGLIVAVAVEVAVPLSGRVSVAVLLPGSVSVSPAGGATEAVLVSDTMAAGLIWATAVKVAVPPGSRVTVVAMLPVPLAAATLDPAEATAVQLSAVMPAGNR